MNKLLCFLLLIFLSPDVALARAKIYDCFMFSNELELLEIRLHELYPYVDKFVLVESCETHRKGEPKPLFFALNKERFAPFLNKIIHITLHERIETSDIWYREHWQRNQIMRGLKDCSSDDIIIISDADEIPPGWAVAELEERMQAAGRIVFLHKMYRFFLNRYTPEIWAGSGVVWYHDLCNLTPQGVRDLARSGRMGAFCGGWHFTSMGGYEKICFKYRTICEGGDTIFDEEDYRRQVNSHILVPIDDSFPKFVQENIDYLIDLNMIGSLK